MTHETRHPVIVPGDHKAYMKYALTQAQLSPPSPTKFCVGAVLLDATKNEILSTGYSLELPTAHAEQCCFIKIAQKHNIPEERLVEVLPENTVLYTTMEPCNKRLSGNKPCVDRILALKGKIRKVYVGVKEPGTFVGEDILVVGRGRLRDGGVEVLWVEGMEERILEISLAGHEEQ